VDCRLAAGGGGICCWRLGLLEFSFDLFLGACGVWEASRHGGSRLAAAAGGSAQSVFGSPVCCYRIGERPSHS
jgi:hypothetical protein